jgi:hypothetical protein
MQEVIKSIDELHSLLETKVKSYEKKFQMVSKMQSDVEEKDRVLIAKSKRLAVMERIYKKYEDFDTEKKKFDAVRKDYAAEVAKIEKKIHENTVVLQEAKDETDKLETKKKVIGKQAVALKEKEAKFNKDKAELKALVNGDTLKGMLK